MHIRSIHLRIFIGLCLFTAILLFLDVTTIVSHLSDINLYWFAAAVISIAFSSIIGAFNIFILINRNTNLSWPVFLPIYWSGWSLSLIVPGQVGDIAGIATLLRKYNIDWHTSIGKSLVDKFNSLFVTLLYAFAGIIIIGLTSDIEEVILPVVILATLIFFSLLWLYRWQFRQDNKIQQHGIRGLITRTLIEIFQTVSNYPLLTVLNLGLTFIKLGFTGLAYWCVFQALNITDLEVLPVIFIASASSIIAYVPISFNGLGTVEVTGIYLFSHLGISAPAIFSAYLILRVIVLLMAWLPTWLWLSFKE